MKQFVAEAKAWYKEMKESGRWVADAFWYPGEWSVYYGDGNFSYAMSYETALSYMNMFNAHLIIKTRGFRSGRIITS